ncbi:MAG: NUDIX hydrolase [Chitinophagales bacterium]
MNNIEKSKRRETKYQIYSVPIESFFEIAFSIDCVVFGYGKRDLQVLLIQRGAEPFKGLWALPGDLVYPDEDLDSSPVRVLKDLTSLPEISFEQGHTFGAVNRHPLGRVITVAYFALVNISQYNPTASFWAEKAKWHSIKNLPKLAFDHKEIIEYSLQKFKETALRKPLWNSVLPPKFTLTELQHFFEVVLDRQFDKGNFRKKLDILKYVKETDEYQENVSHRPARLFAFDDKLFYKYEK